MQCEDVCVVGVNVCKGCNNCVGMCHFCPQSFVCFHELTLNLSSPFTHKNNSQKHQYYVHPSSTIYPVLPLMTSPHIHILSTIHTPSHSISLSRHHHAHTLTPPSPSHDITMHTPSHLQLPLTTSPHIHTHTLTPPSPSTTSPF